MCLSHYIPSKWFGPNIVFWVAIYLPFKWPLKMAILSEVVILREKIGTQNSYRKWPLKIVIENANKLFEWLQNDLLLFFSFFFP